jgi:hypothetical protein
MDRLWVGVVKNGRVDVMSTLVSLGLPGRQSSGGARIRLREEVINVVIRIHRKSLVEKRNQP